MQEIRCQDCNKKLGAGVFYQLQIKCPRCGYFNNLSAMSAKHNGDHGHAGITRNSLARRQASSSR
ncbi:Com family DNA-binding transcriptional regulator [Methylobacillus glycogenes]|uniref:Com family DNA-binding transcriptional regulator n=1 Tax=Methylobacillus glycogenes TaxID=406 RepID=UPI0009DD0CF5